jgi:AraC-like DNA-binding protein
MEPCYKTGMHPPLAWYREFMPCKALRADVYAFFSFVPGSVAASPMRPILREIAFHDPALCAPQFADAHVSMMFEIGQTFDAEGRWRAEAKIFGGTVVGPMTCVGRTDSVDLSETVGVYFRPARAAPFFDVAMSELTDAPVAIADIWGPTGSRLSSALCELNEAARIDRLEAVLLTRLRHRRQRTGALDVEGLAGSVLRGRGRVRVEAMARDAGVSRQHLAREFRERIGIGPKLYTRLARFQSVLAYSGSRANVDWASVAVEAGFFDQSHMIAEFRQFSGLTPRALADGDWFHPFIVRARPRTLTGWR